MKRFCYRCGALETGKGPLVNGLCQECFAAENPLLRVPGEISVKICGRCGAYMIDREWQGAGGDPDKAALNAAREATLSELKVAQITPAGTEYVQAEEAKGIKIEVKPELTSSGALVKVSARGKIRVDQAEPQTALVEVKIKMEQTTCDICSRISSGYYEAILQVRGGAELPPRELSRIKQRLESQALSAHEQNRAEFVAKVESKHEGLDLYVSSAKLARQLAETLKSEFGAEVKESAKLVGQTKSGKRKFRISVLARLPTPKK